MGALTKYQADQLVKHYGEVIDAEIIDDDRQKRKLQRQQRAIRDLTIHQSTRSTSLGIIGFSLVFLGALFCFLLFGVLINSITSPKTQIVERNFCIGNCKY